MNTGVINNVEYRFLIERLFVRQHEDAPNAVARVHWVCVLSRNGAKVLASGQTDLSAPDSGAFINIAELEAAQVLNWVVAAEGGQVWLESFVDIHEGTLQAAEQSLGLEAWHIPLVNPLKFDPQNV